MGLLCQAGVNLTMPVHACCGTIGNSQPVGTVLASIGCGQFGVTFARGCASCRFGSIELRDMTPERSTLAEETFTWKS
jgi:hypothetical protein